MVDTRKIIVVGDRILIRPEDDLQKTNSGLYLPPGVAQKEKVQGGYVIKVGPGYAIPAPIDDDEPWKENEKAKYIPLQAKEGDFVLFLRKDAVELELDKQKHVIISQNSILLILRDEDLLT
ncbi:MAG: co-chaperone GroES family protein [Bacteroidetes bacterium]|nr:co-chaperone GroES family protein [Bacteroidota bacterium]